MCGGPVRAIQRSVGRLDLSSSVLTWTGGDEPHSQVMLFI